MAVALNSLRSHFSKHVSCTTVAATFYFFSTSIAQPRKPFSFLSSAAKQQLPLCSLSFITTFAASPSSSTSETLTTDSFASPYLSARIFCRKDFSDMLSEALLCFGASSTSMDEQDDNEDNEEICISSIFPISQDVEECLSRAADSVGLKETPNYHVEMHDHTDWIKATQESFHPVEVKEGLWIVPEWKTPPELGATNIILNPGLAFGTGEHPTTKLCLLLLHNLIKGGEVFLDYGTGSGVLAIAALKFGASLSVGVDIDPQAITSARHNADLNNIEPGKFLLNLVRSTGGAPVVDGVPGEDLSGQNSYAKGVFAETQKYDVVIANILLNPLLDLADQIVSYARPGAIVGLSGIISEQVPTIVERYSPFLDGITVSKMDGWACISGSKKES